MKLVAVGLLFASMLCQGQSLPFEPQHESGASVTGAFEGWFQNADGTYSLLLGYMNRNSKQSLDIPIGPNNRIEPGGPDQGQPTHFNPGRNWGIFTIKVPADFGKNKLTWTIVANGQNTVIPMSLHTDYEISPMIEASVGNTPPVVRFEERGASGQGPVGVTATRTAKVGAPLSITAWVEDDAKLTTSSGAPPRNLGSPVTLTWSKFRGPGDVTFSETRPAVDKSKGGSPGIPFAGKSTTAATFGAAGDYVLHVTLNDFSGEGGQGFQCCWTNGFVKVSVAP